MISIVNSKGQVLYNMRLGPHENQYFSVDDQPITKEEADRLSAASAEAEACKRGELPPTREERRLTAFEQRGLEILKQAAWHAKLRADRRPKM